MALVSGKQRRRAAKEGMHVTGQSNSLDVTAVIAEFLGKEVASGVRDDLSSK